MKATLEFNLPEENQEHLDAINGTSWKITLSNFDNTFRCYLKHGHNFSDIKNCLDSLRKQLHEDIEDNGLRL